MKSQIEDLIAKITTLEAELEVEFAKRSAGLRFGLEQGRIVFEEEVRRRHQALKTATLKYILNARSLVILVAPVIYSLIIPFVILDIFVSVYQAICFPVYGIEKVRRKDYFIFDRSSLGYLNAIEKLNCAYCAYGNGLIAYVREIAARTERYWCPIKHARRVIGAHGHYRDFADYGDAEAFDTLKKH